MATVASEHFKPMPSMPPDVRIPSHRKGALERRRLVSSCLIMSHHYLIGSGFGLDDVKDYLILHDVCRFGHVNLILAQSQERIG